MSGTMKAMVLTGHGDFDKLAWREDWPKPSPGAGEVLIRVGACGLNNTDINTRTAWYSKAVSEGITEAAGSGGFEKADAADATWSGSPLSFPRIQGADTVGRIEAVGDGVDPGRMGERVIVDPWLLGTGDWLDPKNAPYYGSECDGGFAEYTVIRASNAHRIESDLSDAELATFPCALTTAENLVMKADPQPGETVVIAGASGGVGTTAVQLCRIRGARVIGIASAAKTELLRKLGCDAVIDRATPCLEAAIRDVAGGSVEAALDVVGGSMFMPLVNALRQGGRYASCGAISGPTVEFDLRQLIYKDLRLSGATITPPGTMARLVKLIERGLVRPQLAATFRLRDLHDAQRAFLAKKHVGNIVVEP
ncbi:alcohol dehydrogenase family protein [Ostreiculturibacter nitratireducens]|uniref:alcohol dehydrogenase family protein n=1 Tax=Ostreiculturibacter nitratireducens TaxID=3075226 RepID=UPI0031B59A35